MSLNIDLYDWQMRFSAEGLTYDLRLKLLDLLKPHVRLSEPFRILENNENNDAQNLGAPARIKDLVNWEIVLGADDAHAVLGTLRQNSHWQETVPLLLSDFTSLLRETLDLMHVLEGANDRADNS